VSTLGLDEEVEGDREVLMRCAFLERVLVGERTGDQFFIVFERRLWNFPGGSLMGEGSSFYL